MWELGQQSPFLRCFYLQLGKGCIPEEWDAMGRGQKGDNKTVQKSAKRPQNYLDMIWTFFRQKSLERMAERKRAQAAKAMEKKSMNPKVN